MKKITVIIAITLFFQTMMAAQTKMTAQTKVATQPVSSAKSYIPVSVPQSVVNAFSTQFPDGKLKNWETRKEGYIARFVRNGKKLFAYYTADGKWQGTETPVKWTKNLPDSVKAGWKNTEYYRWYVEEIKKIETPEQNIYVLKVNNGPTLDANHSDVFKEVWILKFTSGGTLLTKERVD